MDRFMLHFTPMLAVPLALASLTILLLLQEQQVLQALQALQVLQALPVLLVLQALQGRAVRLDPPVERIQGVHQVPFHLQSSSI
jgi:hypothetical protein